MAAAYYTRSALSLISCALAMGCHPRGDRLPTAIPERTPYPNFRDPDDPLAHDPCGVKATPDIFVRDVSNHGLLTSLHENLVFLEEANPILLCGLERIELLGDEAYGTGAPSEYTRRSVGLYTPSDRVIRLKASAGIVLTHEVGHHIHNLGYFAPTVRAFLDQSWESGGYPGQRKSNCPASDCFINAAAAENPREDWARTFEMVLMRPIETSVATNFSLNGITPLQEKIRLMRSLLKTDPPLPITFHFGTAVTLDEAQSKKLAALASARTLPSSLRPEIIRQLFIARKSSLKSSVWDQRQTPLFLANLLIFPVFQEGPKRLGFFAYDLEQNRLRATNIALKNVPEIFREEAKSFDRLYLAEDGNTIWLVGWHQEEAAFGAPINILSE